MSEQDQKELSQTLWSQALAAIIPQEILEDGLHPETRQAMLDLLLASIIMAIILLPNYCCFKTKYQTEIEKLEDEGNPGVEIDFTAE